MLELLEGEEAEDCFEEGEGGFDCWEGRCGEGGWYGKGGGEMGVRVGDELGGAGGGRSGCWCGGEVEFRESGGKLWVHGWFAGGFGGFEKWR